MKPTPTSGKTMALTAAVGLVSGIGAFLLHRSLSPDAATWSRSGAEALDTGAADTLQDPPNSVIQEHPVDAQAARRDPHAEALRHPSDGFRNASLTAVIREAGYVCTSILSAAAGTEDLGAWRVSCADALTYLVSEDDAGSLGVEPIPYTEGSPLNVVRPLKLVPESPRITLPRQAIPPD